MLHHIQLVYSLQKGNVNTVYNCIQTPKNSDGQNSGL